MSKSFAIPGKTFGLEIETEKLRSDRVENSLDFTQFGNLAPLARLLASGASAADCADMLGVSRGTISRQIEKLSGIILEARNNTGAASVKVVKEG